LGECGCVTGLNWQTDTMMYSFWSDGDRISSGYYQWYYICFVAIRGSTVLGAKEWGSNSAKCFLLTGEQHQVFRSHCHWWIGSWPAWPNTTTIKRASINSHHFKLTHSQTGYESNWWTEVQLYRACHSLHCNYSQTLLKISIEKSTIQNSSAWGQERYAPYLWGCLRRGNYGGQSNSLSWAWAWRGYRHNPEFRPR
jgi:hypothetical protein